MDTQNNENILGAVAYLLVFISGIALLILEKKNKFIRFHAMQSTILFGGIFILNLGLGFIPVLGWIAGMLLSLLAFILWLMLMWKAFNGEMYQVPYVGEIAKKQLEKMG